MKPRLLLAGLAMVIAGSCANTSTSTTTWSAPPAAAGWTRAGYVESISEIVERVEGNPAGGALAGALIGGVLFGHRGHASLFGAATGAALGAAASQGRHETRTYHVLVRFDDGTHGMFVYAGPPPFLPGQPVALTAQGLGPR